MSFRTKLDYSDNRQIQQRPETLTILSGGTAFGVTFSALTTGPDLLTSGITSSVTSAASTFSGNSATTVYNWYDPIMQLGYPTLTAITISTSANTQYVTAYSANTTTVIDGNTVALDYVGVAYDITCSDIYDLGGGAYSGTAVSLELDFLSAVGLDFTGRTIWADVSGITRTENLIITNNPVIGNVWTCIDTEGRGYWSPVSGSSGSSIWELSTGVPSAVLVGSGSLASGNFSVAEGSGTTASGTASHAEGYLTTASANYSHAQGWLTKAIGDYGAHAEGFGSTASGDSSHAEGNNTQATGYVSHSEGTNTLASGAGSHAEGGATTASGQGSHAEGGWTTASGVNSHAQGNYTIASGDYGSHSEGYKSLASGEGAHAEGGVYSLLLTGGTASGIASHAEGGSTTASGTYSHAEGYQTKAIGDYATHSEGFQTTASGLFGSHAEGYQTAARGNYSHAEGNNSIASGETTHAEGYQTQAYGNISHTEGLSTTARGVSSHAEGGFTLASGDTSHAEGYYTIASGLYSHAEGWLTMASGAVSHAEGYRTTASGSTAHAEGELTTAATTSHAEGQSTTAIGLASHSQNYFTAALANFSHAGGSYSTASGVTSFVHGNSSIAGGSATIVLGNSITGTSNNTTYVDNLNIKTIGAGPGTSIAVDGTGQVVYTTSDLRLKENISTLTNALDKVKNLRGVTFQLKDRNAGGDDFRIGFIAQEVNEVIPELTFVNKTIPEEYMGVHYDNVTALLVEAIKEIASGSTTIINDVLNTQTVVAEDNNIDLNFGGTQQTAIDGGIRVLHAKGVDLSSDFILDANGDWTTNNDFKPNQITIPLFTPSGSTDTTGNLGNITRDDTYIYVKCSDGWKRSNLESF